MNDQTSQLPADRGLAGLGLLMQVCGSTFAALSTLMGVSLILSARGAPEESSITLWLLVATISAIARSLMHRNAGAALLYPDGTPPFAPLKKYVVASLVNTALWGYLLHSQIHAPNDAVVPVVLALMAWPVALVVIAMLPGFRDLADRIPTAEDKGFEGAALLMLVFGLLGTLFMSVLLYATWTEAPPEAHSQGAYMMVVLAMIALVIRSALQVSAALTGLRETRMDLVLAAANRYCDFGVVSSFIAGGVLLLAMMMITPDPTEVAVISCLVWALLAWPMILRRFFGERQFADLLASQDGPGLHHRAPDLGLTTLGWLLLGQALLTLSFGLPGALSPHHVHGLDELGGPLGALSGVVAASAGNSPWWGVGVAALELWAAIELVRMSELHRIAASAFGAIAAAVTVYQNWSLVRALLHGHGGAIAASTAAFAMLAAQLTVPLVTLFAANRRNVPAATARFT